MSQSIYRRYFLTLAVLGILLVSFLAVPSLILVQPARAAWEPDWLYRKSITINHSLVPDTLVNFPVLINITGDGDLGSHAQPDGDDILFTDGSGQLSHEIESYSAGNLVAWVKVPSLSSSVDTVLYMYYGNSGVGNQEDPAGVWDSNFMMVQHLGETSGTHYDSTVNGNNGSPVNGVVQGAAGKIDGADNFDGTNDYVNVPDSNTLAGFSTAFTASFWMKMDVITGRRTFLNKWNTGTGQRAWYIDYDSTRGANSLGLFVSADGNAYSYWYAAFSPVAGNWYHIAVVWRSGQPPLFYVNGAAVSLTTSTVRASIYNNAEPLYIGRSYTTDRYFDGVIDEVRLSNVTRSPEWVSTCYDNQVNPSSFYVVGPEEPYGLPIVSNPIPIDGAINVLKTTSQLSFDIVDPNGDLMNYAVSTYPNIGGDSKTGQAGGTKTVTVGGLNYATTYTWHVNVTDGSDWTNMTYTFTTESGPPLPPVVSDPDPSDGATDVSVSLDELSVNVSDPNGDLMNITVTTDPDIGSGEGLKIPGLPPSSFTIAVSGLEPGKTYEWNVSVTDGPSSWTNKTCHFTTGSEPSMKHKILTIDHTLVSANLVNYPVLIDITDSDLANYAQSDGDDIYFTDSGDVRLSHEIELYSVGHLVAWVKVPSLSSTVDTVLNMYYGNASAENQEHPSDVWDANFMMVQHLSETSGTHFDSTSNGNNGAPMNAVNQSGAGKIDGADDFDGTNDYVNVPDSNTLAGFSQAFTASCWVKMDSVTGRRTLLNKWNTGTGQRAWYIDYDSTRGTNALGLFASADGSAYSYWYAAFSPVAGNWYYITVVWRSGLAPLFYVNGAAVTATTSTVRASIYNNAEPLYIGTSYTTGRYFDGVIDEVCISNVARSAQWINTSYNNQMDPSAFISELPPEDRPYVVPPPVPGVGATGISVNTVIQITFSEPMNTALTQGAFSINPSVAGSFAWSSGDTVLTFTPGSALAYSTVYTVTISTAAEDKEGENMASPYSWSFTTAPPGPPPPYVVPPPVPGVGATGVAVDTNITVDFSEAMNGTATQGAFSISPSVSGGFGWSTDNKTLTFDPSANLTYSTVYIVTISTAAKSMLGVNMLSPYIWSFTTEAIPGTTKPYVVSTVPFVGQTNVSVATAVVVNFSVPMNQAATQGAFSIAPSVSGVFTWVNSSALRFTPTASLAYCTVYTVTISTAAKDVQNENMAASYAWSFATVAIPGATKPFVVSTWPFVGQTGVSNATTVQVTFNEAMDRNSTQAAFSIDGSVNGAFTWNSANTTLTFTPGPNNLTLSTVYHVTMSTAAQDMQGENMTAPYAYSFTTVASPTSPYITAISPARSAENQSLVVTIRITFSETMDPASVENSFSISPSIAVGDPKFTWASSNRQMTLNYSLAGVLATNTMYTVTMLTGAMDLSDEHLQVNYTWSFTTIPPSPPYVVSTIPIPGETNVDCTIWGVNFSEPMSSSVTWAAFSISPYNPTNNYNNSRWVNSSYIQFYIAPLTNLTTYTVTISTNARDSQGENFTAPYTFAFRVVYHGTFSQSWTYNTQSLGTGESSPLIGDVTSDVGEEVIYVGGDTGSSSGAVVCINGRTGAEIWRYTDHSIGWNVQPQMGDIDNDGQFEIVVPTYSPTGILVLDTDNSKTGTAAVSLKWKRTGIGGSSYTSKPLVVDPDGDGFWMIFCAPEDVRGYGYTNTYTGRIWAFNYDGREMKNGLQSTAGGTRNAYGGTSGSYYQWFAWRPCSGGFAMADADNNGLFELYQNDRQMYYGDGDYGKGTICWEWNATSMSLSLKWYQPDMLVSSHTPILVDVDKDGVLDVVAAHMRGGLAIFNSTTGAEIKKEYDIGLPSHYQPVVYDIDHDGNLEILLADGDHPSNSPPDIVVFDLYKWVTGANVTDCIDARMYVGPCKFPPAVGEVTGDGIMDMIAVSDKGIFVFDGSHDPSVDKTYPVCVVANTNNYQNMYAVVQDIDADGLNEIVVTSSGYRVYAYNTLGIPPTPRPRSEVQYYNERRTGVAEYVPPVFYDRTAPILSNPYPSNEAANVPVNLQRLNFTLTDLQSDKMNYTVTTNFSVDPADLTGLNVGGGTYFVDVVTPPNLTYHTKYTWTVRVTDGVHWNNKTYTFTTPDGAPPGSAPTQGVPLLNSTGVGEYENATSVDLVCINQTTADADKDKVTNIYRWLRNGQSITNLIMPFDTDNLTTVKDYSGYNNNAQIHGATWTSNGKVGGAYSFDGLDDYMTISDGGAGYYNGRLYSSNLGGYGDWHELTVEMWINLAALSTKESTRILMKIPSYEIGLGSIGGSTRANNRLTAAVWLDNPASGDNAGQGEGTSTSPKAEEYWSVSAPSSPGLNTNTWYHVAFTYKDGGGTDYSVLTLYINGVAVTTSSSLTTRGPIKVSSGEPLYIGWFDYFQGMIDEVRIYSRSLSAEQISQRYNETKDGLTNSSTLSQKETLTGESWTCQVTPNDSHQDGTARTSNPLTVLPGPQVPPTVSNVRVLANSTLSTSQAWSNDTVIVIYDYFDENDNPEVFSGSFGTQIRWYQNNTYRSDLDNLRSLSPSITAAHENWTCQIKPGDGYAIAAEWVNATNAVIVNSPPIVTNYSPKYGYSLDHLTFTVGQSQTFSVTFNDLDVDPLTIYWQVGSVNATEAVTYTTLPATSSFTWTAPALGSYTIRARISDTGYGSTSITQSWSIVVR
jgi:hypothetical protein